MIAGSGSSATNATGNASLNGGGGSPGGSVTVSWGPAFPFTLGVDALIQSGDGGHRGNAIVEIDNGTPAQVAVVGGDGGAAGTVTFDGTLAYLYGTVHLGDGGNGGRAWLNVSDEMQPLADSTWTVTGGAAGPAQQQDPCSAGCTTDGGNGGDGGAACVPDWRQVIENTGLDMARKSRYCFEVDDPEDPGNPIFDPQIPRSLGNVWGWTPRIPGFVGGDGQDGVNCNGTLIVHGAPGAPGLNGGPGGTGDATNTCGGGGGGDGSDGYPPACHGGDGGRGGQGGSGLAYGGNGGDGAVYGGRGGFAVATGGSGGDGGAGGDGCVGHAGGNGGNGANGDAFGGDGGHGHPLVSCSRGWWGEASAAKGNGGSGGDQGSGTPAGNSGSAGSDGGSSAQHGEGPDPNGPTCN